MIFVSNELKATPLPDFEQQFAAYKDLSQSLSEEFDRASELHAQAVQTSWETYSQFCEDMSSLKDPQEFFLRGANQLHAWAGQSQQYLHALVALNQQIHEKFLALGKTISPMMINSVIELTPNTELNVIEKVATDGNKPSVLKDINVVANPVSTPKTANSRRRKSLASTTTTVAEVTTTKDSTNRASSTPKAKPVNTTKKSEASISVASTSHEAAPESATPKKKSAVVGLPSKAPARSGFAGAGGQPDYKAKSSKATGAKKRVRQ